MIQNLLMIYILVYIEKNFKNISGHKKNNNTFMPVKELGPSWPWSYGSWIYNYLYAIITYHHWCCEFESRSERGVQHYVIKFINGLRQVDGFLRVLRFPPPIKLITDDITKILLKVAWNTIKQTNKQTNRKNCCIHVQRKK